jgi:hypothetical protein
MIERREGRGINGLLCGIMQRMLKITGTYHIRGVLLVGRARDAAPQTPLAVDCPIAASSPAAAAADAAWLVAYPRGYRVWQWREAPTVETLNAEC